MNPLIPILSRFALATVLLPAFVRAADGGIDQNFGVNGVAYAHAGFTLSTSLWMQPVVQADGKIVLCATQVVVNSPTGEDFFVARFTKDGLLDTAFGNGGKASIDFDGGGSEYEYCNNVALQADGRIVVIGSLGPNGGSKRLAAARLNADGSLDTSFGGTGKVVVPFVVGGSTLSFNPLSAVVQSDDRIIVAGQSYSGSVGDDDCALVRLASNGGIDATFGTDGFVRFWFDPNQDRLDMLSSVVMDAQGRIVVGGSSGNPLPNPGQAKVAVARLLNNGELDPAFGAAGRASISLGSGANGAEVSHVLLAPGGKIVATGYADTSTTGVPKYNPAAIRFLPDGALDTSFGDAGKVVVSFDSLAPGLTYVFGGVVQSNGKLLMTGFSALNGDQASFSVAARLNDDGSLDSQFGNSGRAVYDMASDGLEHLQLGGVALQDTQAIVVGTVDVSGGSDSIAVRLNVDLRFANGFD